MTVFRSKRVSSALFIAFVLASGCTWLLGRHITHQAAAGRAQMLGYISVTRPVGAGEMLTPADLQEILWPAGDPVDGAFTKATEVAGRAALYPLAPGQPLLDRQLATPGSGPGLASKIPNGMRAIALKSDEVVGVGGFLNPGSHVDVLVTYRNEGAIEPMTATVLQNAEVIAAGQQLEPDPTGKAVAATVVTLLLAPHQAERALLASSQGSVHFVLRNSADTSTGDNAPVSLSELASLPVPAVHAVATNFVSPAPFRHTAAPKQSATPTVERSASIEVVLGGQPAGVGAGGAWEAKPR